MHLLAALLFIFSSQAQQGFLGVNAGATDATGPLTKKEVAASVGGRGGFIFYERIGIGALTHYYVSREPGLQISYLPIMAELTYFVVGTPNSLSSVHISALFGTTNIVSSTGAGKSTENATTVGWSAGYSVLLADRYALGPEIQSFHVFGNENFRFWGAQLSLKILF